MEGNNIWKTVNTQQNHGFLKLGTTIKMQDGTMPTENHRGGISNFSSTHLRLFEFFLASYVLPTSKCSLGVLYVLKGDLRDYTRPT